MNPRHIIHALALIILLVSFASAQPIILYTDITSGPSTGGEDDNGAIVSIFGKGFKDNISAIKVYIGDGEVARNVYLGKSLGRPDIQQLAVQIGPAATSGKIRVVVDGEESNTDHDFTVRAGNIFFVAVGGNNTNSGSFNSPFKTLDFAKSRLLPGDILYAMDGVEQLTPDSISGNEAALRIIETAGSAHAGEKDHPIALIAYPGSDVRIGCTDSNSGCPSIGVRLYMPYWVVSGFYLSGTGEAMDINDYKHIMNGTRVVNNDATSGYYGMSSFAAPDSQILGNTIHDTPHSGYYYGGSDKYQSQNIEVAWNVLHDIEAFGIKFYYAPPSSSASPEQRFIGGVSIHNNLIYNMMRAPILVGGHDWGDSPWITDAKIYNNIIYDFEMTGNEGAIRIGNAGGDETELEVSILHNTVVLSSSAMNAVSLEIDACKTAVVQNNLFVQAQGNYVSAIGPGQITMSNNGYYGGTSVPSYDTNPIEGYHYFVNMSEHDFHMLNDTGNHFIDSGAITYITMDFDGMPRPMGQGYDIGAYEYTGEYIPPAYYCGDGICGGSGENCSTCPQDCGSCPAYCIHNADTEPCDSCIDNDELFAYIDRWKSGDVIALTDLMQAVILWKEGCG